MTPPYQVICGMEFFSALCARTSIFRFASSADCFVRYFPDVRLIMLICKREDYHYHQYAGEYGGKLPQSYRNIAQLRIISLWYPPYRDDGLESLALSEILRQFPFILRRIALSALAHLHSLHLVLWIGSHLKFSLPFEFSRMSWGDDERLNCRGKIACWNVFHAQWMWVIRKGMATNEDLRDVRSLSFVNASGMRNARLVSLGNKKPSCGTTTVRTCTCSVNRKLPISIRANIYWRVMRLA